MAAGSTIYIKGGPDDRFIFSSSMTLSVGANANVVLVADGTGGGGPPMVSNIVWRFAMNVAVLAGAHGDLKGIRTLQPPGLESGPSNPSTT